MHPLNSRFDTPYQITATFYPELEEESLYTLGKRLASLQVQDRYLITETLSTRYNARGGKREMRQVKVFDLLQPLEQPNQARKRKRED